MDAAISSPNAFATFPRRLNALSVDVVVLVALFYVVVLLQPVVEPVQPLRISLFVLMWVGLLGYEPVLVAWKRGTVGHHLMNLEVVDSRTGRNLGLLRAIIRWWVKVLLGWIAFLTIGMTKKHQALHDVLTRSSVAVRDLSRAKAHHYVRLAEGGSR